MESIFVKRAAATMVLWGAVACSSMAPSTTAKKADPGGDAGKLPVSALDSSNVNSFGKVFERPVDGLMSAQPVYVPDVRMPDGTTRNVLILATAHDSVYAYDADDPAASAPLWRVAVGTPATLPNPWFANWSDEASCKGQKSTPSESGITSTPAVDLATGTIYVSAFVQDASAMRADQACTNIDPTSPTWCQAYRCSAPTFRMELHALDVRTGAERAGSPVTMSAQVPGSGAGSLDGVITFDPTLQLQRAALLLSNGNVYVAFGSYSDIGNYHGWILAYDATSLAQVAAFNDTPEGAQGGIWQSGRAPVADEDGNIYVISGNGTFNAQDGGHDFGDAFLKLDKALHVLDWFAPYLNDLNGQNLLELWDGDLGSAGPLLVPNTNLIVGGGKTGVLYVLDRTHLGNFDHDTDDVVQSLMVTWRSNKASCGDGVDPAQIYGTPVLWNADDGPRLFMWGVGDYLRSYRMTNGQFATEGAPCFCQGESGVPADPFCGAPEQMGAYWANFPGAFLTLSGGATGGAIVWATRTSSDGGLLEAYDAADVTHLLWSSATNADKDSFGLSAKLTPPLVAGGKVYVATASNKVVAYGRLPSP
jgi:hypothetical protein